MRLSWPNRWSLRFAVGVAPLAENQVRREFVDDLRWPHVAGVHEVQIDLLADDPGVARLGGADQVGRELQHGVVVELGRQPLLRQLDAIAFDAREADLERVALGPDGLHLDGLARRLRRRDDRLGGEVERDAEDVGVLDVEQARLRSGRRTGGAARGRSPARREAACRRRERRGRG